VRRDSTLDVVATTLVNGGVRALLATVGNTVRRAVGWQTSRRLSAAQRLRDE
jgi:hypothetical protein